MSKEKLLTYNVKEANLFAAITKRHTCKAIELMKQEGINLNAKNCQGETFLRCAVSRGNQEVVKALIQAGVQLDIKDNQGHTPLVYANANNNQSIINLLVESHIALLVDLYTQYCAYSNKIPQENVINPRIAEGGPNIEERKLEPEEIEPEDNNYVAPIPLQGIEEEENKGGDNNQVDLILPQSNSHSQGAQKVPPAEHDFANQALATSSSGTNYPAASDDNKKSNWAAFKNFFSSLVSTLSVKVLGLYIPGMPLGSSAEKSAYAVPPSQNKQKWWKSPQENVGGGIKLPLFIDTKLYNFNQFDYNKNSSLMLFDSEKINDSPDESMLALSGNTTQ